MIELDELQALCSMAIKINMMPKDQEALHHTLEAAGYKRQKRTFHCTVGFIENSIPIEKAENFGESITHELQDHINHLVLYYEVDKAIHLFGRVIALLPTASSQKILKEINQWLFAKVQEMSGGEQMLNRETSFEDYTPHLTLHHTHKPDVRLKILEKFAETHPTYYLTEAAYVLFC